MTTTGLVSLYETVDLLFQTAHELIFFPDYSVLLIFTYKLLTQNLFIQRCDSVIYTVDILFNFGYSLHKMQDITAKVEDPKSVIAFNLFTFFCEDLIQSDVNWKLSPTFDWIMSPRKKGTPHFWDPCCKSFDFIKFLTNIRGNLQNCLFFQPTAILWCIQYLNKHRKQLISVNLWWFIVQSWVQFLLTVLFSSIYLKSIKSCTMTKIVAF